MSDDDGSDKRYLAIINPAAGGGRCGAQADGAVEQLRNSGMHVEVALTSRAGEATELARKAYADGVRHFIAVGGDGTGFEVVNGLFPEAIDADVPPSLGFLPLGTGNSFLRDFTDQGAEHARRALMDGSVRGCDVMRLRHKQGEVFFINLLSLGFVADVCALANRRFKRFGEASYGLGVVAKTAALRCRPLPLQQDGGPREDAPLVFLSINNSRFTGGKMMMAPEADTADGLADVISVGELGRVGLLKTFPKIFSGTHTRHPAVRTSRARHIDFDLPGPTDAMIDGEVIELWPQSLDVLPGALQVQV